MECEFHAANCGSTVDATQNVDLRALHQVRRHGNWPRAGPPRSTPSSPVVAAHAVECLCCAQMTLFPKLASWPESDSSIVCGATLVEQDEVQLTNKAPEFCGAQDT